MFGLPEVENLQSLANYVHLSSGLLFRMSKCNNNFYKIFKIPKANGGFRTIYCPSKEMKAIQAWILRNILDQIDVSDSATGFRKDRNILENAKCHQYNQFLLCLDVEDFFPSITYDKVYMVFKTIGYNLHVSHILTSLCTCEGKLPQGAVTSPALSNIVCLRLDHRISGYVGRHNVTYTRYADDITLSSLSRRRLSIIKNVVIKILSDEGFRLNDNKTRFLGPCRQRRVTGLIISDKSLGIGRKKKRILRAKIHRLLTAGLSKDEETSLMHHIKGWFAHLNSVDNIGFEQLKNHANHLCKKHEIENLIFQ